MTLDEFNQAISTLKSDIATRMRTRSFLLLVIKDNLTLLEFLFSNGITQKQVYELVFIDFMSLTHFRQYVFRARKQINSNSTRTRTRTQEAVTKQEQEQHQEQEQRVEVVTAKEQPKIKEIKIKRYETELKLRNQHKEKELEKRKRELEAKRKEFEQSQSQAKVNEIKTSKGIFSIFKPKK